MGWAVAIATAMKGLPRIKATYRVLFGEHCCFVAAQLPMLEQRAADPTQGQRVALLIPAERQLAPPARVASALQARVSPSRLLGPHSNEARRSPCCMMQVVSEGARTRQRA